MTFTSVSHSRPSPTSPSKRLVDQVSQVLIVAYRESTDRLEHALSQEGLPYEVIRQQDLPEYQGYSGIYRSMLNHRQAWERAAQAEQPTMIVEGDFVPVIGMGQLPLPFDRQQANVGMAWLYTCAAQLYSVTPEGFGEGYSTGLVAYILTPLGAKHLCDMADEVTRTHGTSYYNYDSDIDRFLRSRHCKNYIAFRNYGEHGGKVNPQHQRQGLSGVHRADVLYGPLAFLPDYAVDQSFSFLALLQGRMYGRLKGAARLFCGRFLRPTVARTSSVPFRLIQFAVHRQLSLRL